VRERKWELARQDFDTVLRLNRGLLLAATMRGAMNEELGNYSAALADYDRIAKITPSTLPLTLAMALTYRAQLRAIRPDPSFRNASQAIGDARIACDASKWAKANYISVLAAAYAEAGDFDSAIRFEQKAIDTVRRTNGSPRLKSDNKCSLAVNGESPCTSAIRYTTGRARLVVRNCAAIKVSGADALDSCAA
jgi:tetratricopeptide (TPR) repeat protein